MQKSQTNWETYLGVPALAGLFCADHFNKGCVPAVNPTSVPIASASSLHLDLIGTRLDACPTGFVESLVKLAVPGAMLLADVGLADGCEIV